jgi:hypothetical protein
MLSTLFDFTIYINGESFHCNSSFASCLSQTIFELKQNHSTIQEIHFDDLELDSILNSLFQILNDHSILFSRFDLNMIKSAFKLIGFTSFPEEMASPTNFEEALFFLSQSNSILFEEQFAIASNLIAQRFSFITKQQFLQLTTISLESILSSPYLCLPSEDYLFQLILEDPRKNQLSKFVIFPACDYQLITQFLQELDLTEIDIGLFGCVKNLFSFPQERVFKNRWTNLPKVLSLNQLYEIFNILSSFSSENPSYQEQLKQLISNYKEFDIQNHQLQIHLQTEINENQILKNQLNN